MANPVLKAARSETEPTWPNGTEPNRLIPEPAGNGRGIEANRPGPSHGASEKRRPNRVEPGTQPFRTEPNRTEPMNFKKSGTEKTRTEPAPS